MASVLIVDDEPNIRRMLAALLTSEGYDARGVPDGEAALAALAESPPDAVLLDLMMPGPLDGLATLARLRELDGEAPVIMMSGRAGLSDAVRATKLGAFNFLEKPLSPETVLLALAAALELRQARQDARALRAELGLSGQLVGTSAPMRQVAELIARIAPSDARVLISGESGTGKELVAAAVHEASLRRDRPFVRVNCAAIPRDLVESEMFGHERGAFTGATSRRIGRFELAHTGTLFLDEVGDLGPEAQAKLLRAIEAKEIERVGGGRPIRIDVRIVAATNKNLLRAVSAGTFREDLYFRLNVLPIDLPPLRERPDDIPALVQHFTIQHQKRTGRAVTAWSPEALRLLAAHSWPGNVRELANIVERLIILHASEVVTPADVSAVLPAATRHDPTRVQGSTEPAGADPEAAGAKTASLAGTPEDLRLADALDGYERTLITSALAAADGNVTEAARRLKTDRPNLYRRMRRLGITLTTVLVGALSLSAFWTASAIGQGRDSTVPAAGQAAPVETDSAHQVTGHGDTVPPNRADTTHAGSEAWWRMWLTRSKGPNYTQLSVASLHTYNRIEGLPVEIGPRGRRTFGWGSVSVEGAPILHLINGFSFNQYYIGHTIDARVDLNTGTNYIVTVGGRLYDVIDPVESWQLSDGEIGFATFLLHRDMRDYFDRFGNTGYVSISDNDAATLTLSYAYDHLTSRVAGAPFSLFDNTGPWRPNPALDDGAFELINAHFTYDTRDNESVPWTGWYTTVDLERGAGQVTSFGPRTDGTTPPVPPPGGSPVTYVRGFLDGRRYNRIGADEHLNFRLIVAGWLGGDELPLERRFSMGGAGSLPGFDFRNAGNGPDVASCSVTVNQPPGGPAQCDRMVLAQIEFQHELHFGLGDVVRGVPTEGSWVLFTDGGRGWLVGATNEHNDLTYSASTLPAINTFLADVGAGMTIGPFGFYVAEAVAPWNAAGGPRFVVRLQQRF
jgi:two-component system nitrogen regulation response regulator NtrX